MAQYQYLLSVLILLLSPLTSNGIPHQRTKLLTSEESGHRSDPSPTTFFEVTRPIPVPEKKCSALLLRHDFAYTYGLPPVTAPYRPPSCLRRSLGPPPRAVLEWSAASRGRQYDRIFGVWIAGAELLRSCTAEPRASGILWTVQKDITKYSSLLSRPQTLAVYLANIVDQTYTGVYHVNVSIHFYFPSADSSSTHRQPLPPGFASPADLILPISRHPVPNDDGLWFTIWNSTDVQSAAIAIPRNSYRAVLEVYLSFHSDDEFWYSNPPNDYASANNLTGAINGPFREVVVTLDGDVVGAIWPFTVVYTGGVNPLLWRPITGIGSFDLPTYDIEITPFLGKILDGKPHTFGFGVTNGLNFWFVDANLHLWLDSKSSYTVGELIKYEAPKFSPSLVSKFDSLDGQFTTTASRQISSTGWVKSSYGKITTHFFQTFDYENFMQFTGNGSIQVVNQTIDSSYGVYAKNPSSILYSEQLYRNFPLYFYTGTTDEIGNNYSQISDVSLGFNTKKFSGERSGFTFSSLRNSQKGEGKMMVSGNLVTGGIAGTQQVYKYESTDGCYFRNVSSRNYTILHDKTDDSCTEGSPMASEYSSGRWLPFPARRVSLASDLSKLKNGD